MNSMSSIATSYVKHGKSRLLIGEYPSLAHVKGNQPLVNKGCLFLTDLHFLVENVFACLIAWNFFLLKMVGISKLKNVVHTSFGCFIFLKCSISFNEFLPLKLDGYLSSIIGKKKFKNPPHSLQSVKTSVVGFGLALGFNSCEPLILIKLAT